MRIIIRTDKDQEGISYDISEGKPVSVPNVLGKWYLKATARSPAGVIDIHLCDPERKPDWMGRRFPRKKSVLSFSHPIATFHRGLLGSLGTVRIERMIR